MAFTLPLASYCLGYLVVFLGGYEVTAMTASFEIERGRHDTFRNLQCHQTSQDCTTDQCRSYRAECLDGKCERCRCNKDGRNTFVTSGPNTGNCTKDENIIPESIPKEDSFRVVRRKGDGNPSNQCLTVGGRQNEKIYAKNCTSSLNMRWVWINNENIFRLMNVMTLQCLEFIEDESMCKSSTSANKTGEVVMKQCDQSARQNIIKSGPYLYTSLCNSGRTYYLRIPQQKSTEGHLAFSRRRLTTEWILNDQNLNWKNNTRRGCYRFQNEGFMLFLDGETCHDDPCSHQFSAPIFSTNKNCRIKWPESTFLSSSDVMWRRVSGNMDDLLFSIKRKSNDTQTLKVFKKAFKKFSGSLLRLAIFCEAKMHPSNNENKCLLLKFKFLPRITTTEGQQSSTEMNNGENTTAASILTTVKQKHQNAEESSIILIAVAVPVSILAVILVVVLFYFVCYRRQKRDPKLSNDQGNINNPCFTTPSYEDPNRVYQTIAVYGQASRSLKKRLVQSTQTWIIAL